MRFSERAQNIHIHNDFLQSQSSKSELLYLINLRELGKSVEIVFIILLCILLPLNSLTNVSLSQTSYSPLFIFMSADTVLLFEMNYVFFSIGHWKIAACNAIFFTINHKKQKYVILTRLSYFILQVDVLIENRSIFVFGTIYTTLFHIFSKFSISLSRTVYSYVYAYKVFAQEKLCLSNL